MILIANALPTEAVWLGPIAAAAMAALGGARVLAPEAPAWRVLVLGCSVTAAIAVAVFAQERGSGVPDRDFVEGLLLAALLFGVVPWAAYFGLGRALAQRRRLLAILFVLSLVALVVYVFMALVATLALVSCGPDAYECPL